MKPLLWIGPFSNRVLLITRWTERDGHITAQTKYDITEQADAKAHRDFFAKETAPTEYAIGVPR